MLSAARTTASTRCGSAMQLTIVQTWKHRELAGAPLLYRLCQPSWRRYHPDWQYRLLDDADIERFVAGTFPRFFSSVWHRYPRGIERADLVRYLWLFAHGGLYADLDFECLRPFDPLLAEVRESIILGRLSRPDHAEGIPNALMIARQPHQRFWLCVIDSVLAAIDARDTIERTGPVALGRALAAYGAGSAHRVDRAVMTLLDIAPDAISDDGVAVMPREYFYPICWISERRRRRYFLLARRFLSHERMRRLFPRSYAVTYWTHAW